jgi:hypothetical protein
MNSQQKEKIIKSVMIGALVVSLLIFLAIRIGKEMK